MNASIIFNLSHLGLTAVSSITGLGPPGLPQRTSPPPSNELIPYVAFGDSITTGASIETCREDRQRSPWGCAENPTAARPYPDILAERLGLTYSDRPADYKTERFSKKSLGLYRAGTWGYTVREAAQASAMNDNNGWLPQLDAIRKASRLVTGSLGVNDLEFSNVYQWAKLYLKPGGDYITPVAHQKIRERSADFDKLFQALAEAKSNGATVIVGLYYNPYDTEDRACSDLKTIANRLVNSLDNELQKRARKAGFKIADFREQFQGHGAGSDESYVFGTECKLSSAVIAMLPKWLGGGGGEKALSIAFDPHPNNLGTEAMAGAMLGVMYDAD